MCSGGVRKKIKLDFFPFLKILLFQEGRGREVRLGIPVIQGHWEAVPVPAAVHGVGSNSDLA